MRAPEPKNADEPKTGAGPQRPSGAAKRPKVDAPEAKEIGGRDGPEPTRYGDWEVNGICVDF